MEQRIFHGNITPADIARDLMASFNRGNLRAQVVGGGDRMAVQIATSPGAASGGQTALTVSLQKVSEGVLVQIGQQAWLGVAASLGTTVFTALRNPLGLLGRLDDLAQDIENLGLGDSIWQSIEQTARNIHAGHEIAEKLRRLTCAYCGTANPVGEPSCIACGAPLGSVQPDTCRKCGYVVRRGQAVCPNCGQALILQN
jgi:predicted RNA-binding Zn-ribbon protein involved in translation (DUF1610 family)